KIPEKAFFKHSNKSSCSKTLINPSFEAHYLLCNTLYFLDFNGKLLSYTYAISNSCTFYRFIKRFVSERTGMRNYIGEKQKGEESMPCTINDYPSSLKNLQHSAKKKAIDIANRHTDEGHGEERAIPIATKQAEE